MKKRCYIVSAFNGERFETKSKWIFNDIHSALKCISHLHKTYTRCSLYSELDI